MFQHLLMSSCRFSLLEIGKQRKHFAYDLHITPEEFENAALFFTVRPTVHTNPSRKRSFSKTFFKPEEFGNVALCLSVVGKYFENGAFRNR